MPAPENSESQKPDIQYREVFNASISETLHQAVKIVAVDPALVIAGTRIIMYQKQAADRRKSLEHQGLLVPPVMIVSITSRCNLACSGCYMQRQRTAASLPDMNQEQIRSLAEQAEALGVSIIVIAGGEPLLRKNEIISLARAFPHVLFPIFTNGLLINEEVAAEIAGIRNIVPMISFEGFRNDTDSRRGDGVYERLLEACTLLAKRHIFFGCSITVTGQNLAQVTDEKFLRHMIGAGVRVFIFVEYVPIEPGTEALVLTGDQQKILHARISGFTEKFLALFIGFPGDETTFGGCLAAGRGFIHVSPSGNLEACPAAPFSDANLTTIPLRDALQSRLLEQIREHHNLLTETHGGCALWTNRAWVSTLLGK
jgi:MoaA/NifB/PqqE/SkfB family radical SAM enzyme